MPITLDQVFVPACQQMLQSISGVLDKAQQHAKDAGIAEQEFIQSKLIESMWPLPNQIQSMWVHSAYAIEQAKTGEFRPNIKDIPKSWDEMSDTLTKATSSLATLNDNELDTIADKPVHFIIGEKKMFEFTLQNFLLSFSLPNVHFHATTAYDILRMKGVELGKFDFLGNIRTQSN